MLVVTWRSWELEASNPNKVELGRWRDGGNQPDWIRGRDCDVIGLVAVD